MEKVTRRRKTKRKGRQINEKTLRYWEVNKTKEKDKLTNHKMPGVAPTFSYLLANRRKNGLLQKLIDVR